MNIDGEEEECPVKWEIVKRYGKREDEEGRELQEEKWKERVEKDYTPRGEESLAWGIEVDSVEGSREFGLGDSGRFG